MASAQTFVVLAESGNQQPEVAVEVGKGTDGRPGIAEMIALGEGDYGSKPGDMIDLGPTQFIEVLAGIGREGFEMAALTFTRENIKDKRGLPRTGQTGNCDELPMGQVKIDVLEVVFVSTPDSDTA